jgi:hypothetical protein
MFTDPFDFLKDVVTKLITPPEFLVPPATEFPENLREPRSQPAIKSEAWYQNRLAQKLGGQTEVSTPDGRIDILTWNEVIEVKTVKQWKQAMGQVLIYGHHYPFHRRRVHLYGAVSPEQLERIRQQCESHGVSVTWEL